MEKRVKKFIIDGNFNIDNKIVCATSGGADSLAMLYILHNLGYECILAHVNHHKRVESEIEEKEMKYLASKVISMINHISLDIIFLKKYVINIILILFQLLIIQMI